MKKFIFSALAAIGLLLSPSCSDENEALSGSGNEALVSFSVNLADGISTKAISDGTEATNLVVEVYEDNAADDEGAVFRQKYTLVNLKKDVTFTLVKGKKYDIIFWAQNEGINDSPSTQNFYDVSDLRHIKVNYGANGGKSNSELRDAFLKVEPNFSVTGPFETTVELRRPFAQVNFMVPETDINAAKAAGFDFENATTSVTFKQVATQLNTLANTVESAADVTFDAAAIPFKNNTSDLSHADKLSIGGTDYYYLATNYILVNTNSAEANTQALTNAYLSILESGTDHKVNVSNLPVQWNHRTNIYGNLLTTQSTFHVEINPIYEDPDHGLAETVDVANVTDIAAKIKAGARTITCAAAISEDVTISIPKVFEAYSGSAETDSKVVIRFTGDITAGKTVTIKYGEGSQSAPHFVDINANGGNWIYQLGESTVTMNGGSVENVTSTTSQNTLVIAAGLTITGSITAEQGGVQILGKVLGEGSEGSAIIMGVDNTGNLEIRGEVNGNITANNDANITITSTATITGNVTATGDNAKIVIENNATVTGDVTGKNVEVSPTADVNDNKINQNNEGSKTTTKIGTPEELIAFAAKVNDGVTTYEGKTVELTQDIDLSGRYWTPIGQKTIAGYSGGAFAGTFDGQHHTISNLKASSNEPNWAAAGLFGTVTGATIKNVKLSNVNVSSTHYAGAIVGYHGDESIVTIENCHVDGGTITSTPELVGSSYDNGDKAGGIVGYMTATGSVTGCSVSNVTIKAYRDLGGIVGATYGAVSGCTANNITLIIDATHNYEGDGYSANANPVVGRKLGTATETNNNATNVVYQVASETALTQAITYAQDATIHLTPGIYIIPDDAKGQTLTFIGTGNPEDTKIATQDDGSYEGCDYSLDGATVTFENITINTNSNTYTGYARCNGTYKNCVINGTYTLYGKSTFEECTFNVSGDVYNIWTWGAQDIVFDGCTFNSDGKALLLFQEGTNTVNLTVKSCIFIDKGGLTSKKAAIEIGDANYGATPTYNVTVSRTTVNGYEINDVGYNTGTTLWGNKNSMPADRLNVTVDGVNVY